MMPDLNTTELRRRAAEEARKSRRQLQMSLFVVHAFIYVAAILVMAALVFGMPSVFVYATLSNSIDLSMIIGGLFVGWGIGVGLHGGALLVDSDWMEKRLKQQAASGVIGRALLDEDEEAALFAKAKRTLDSETVYSLKEDGELEGVEEALIIDKVRRD